MSQPRALETDVSNMVVGMPADDAVDIVVEHIARTQGFKQYSDVYAYWRALSDDQKLSTVVTALTR